MKELKTITEYQLLKFAYCSLLERIAHEVDGKTIKEDTFYMLKNGKFVIAE